MACIPACFLYICIYIIYTLNLGLEIAVLAQEREQGRFKGSSEGAGGSTGGGKGAATREQGEQGEQGGAAGEQRGNTEGALWGSTGA